jgi:hypothetical protein
VQAVSISTARPGSATGWESYRIESYVNDDRVTFVPVLREVR